MKLNHIIISAALLASTGVYAADASLTLTGASDYRFRGVSQSAGDPAIQGSFDIAFDNGFYVGTWASNVDFGDNADIEVDFYAGYYWEISETVGLDTMLINYTYPGYDWDSDYLELINSLYVGDFVFQYAYADDFFNMGESAHYLAVDYSYPLAETAGVFEGITLNAHAGHNFGDYWDDWDVGSFTDLSIGVSATWGIADLSLSYLYNDVHKGMTTSSGPFQNDNTLLLEVSTTFDLFSF